MPYLIFKLHPRGRFEYLQSFDSYRAAKQKVHALRKAIGASDEYTVRMIHANDEPEGERLLAEKREPRPLGEEG